MKIHYSPYGAHSVGNAGQSGNMYRGGKDKDLWEGGGQQVQRGPLPRPTG